ncbi:MAG: hypothetical protein K2J68_10950 [Treponemataceae bacterium]|nr:hypothetical protein [Treponemataceae bacterium]
MTTKQKTARLHPTFRRTILCKNKFFEAPYGSEAVQMLAPEEAKISVPLGNPTNVVN